MHQVTIDEEDRNSLSLLSVSYYNHEDKKDSIARLLSTSFSLLSGFSILFPIQFLKP